jgi:hypothetical protein
MIWAVKIIRGRHRDKIYSISDCRERCEELVLECRSRIGDAKSIQLAEPPNTKRFLRGVNT